MKSIRFLPSIAEGARLSRASGGAGVLRVREEREPRGQLPPVAKLRRLIREPVASADGDRYQCVVYSRNQREGKTMVMMFVRPFASAAAVVSPECEEAVSEKASERAIGS